MFSCKTFKFIWIDRSSHCKTCLKIFTLTGWRTCDTDQLHEEVKVLLNCSLELKEFHKDVSAATVYKISIPKSLNDININNIWLWHSFWKWSGIFLTGLTDCSDRETEHNHLHILPSLHYTYNTSAIIVNEKLTNEGVSCALHQYLHNQK